MSVIYDQPSLYCVLITAWASVFFKPCGGSCSFSIMSFSLFCMIKSYRREYELIFKETQAKNVDLQKEIINLNTKLREKYDSLTL